MIRKHLLFHLLAIATFLILSCLYFYPQLEGKKLPQSDIIQYQSMAHEAESYYKETGNQTLWTNSMFSGMPTYQITGWGDANKIGWLEKAMHFFVPRPIGYFIFAQISFYLMLLLLGVNRWVALSTAISFAFVTNNICLFEAGHTSKLRTLFSAPLVIAGLIMVYRQKLLLGGTIFCAALALNVYTNHPQITYYLAMCLGILVILEGINAVKTKTLPAFAKASGVLVVGTILAVGAASYTLFSTLEYSRDTMRGKATLTEATTSGSNEDGLAWDYATQWSNGIEDLFAAVVPRAAGGSSMEPTPENSNWNALLRERGVQSQDAPLYWGQLPFTSGPAYLGAIVLFLFVFGAFFIKGHLKWWLVGVVVLTFLLSMGKHFAAFNHLLFDSLPFYNKFRAPSSVLTITALFLPILGALAVTELFKSGAQNEAAKKGLLWGYGVVGGFTLLLALIGAGFFDFAHDGDARYSQMGILDAIEADRKSLFRADAFRSFILVTLAFGALWSAHKGWIKKSWIAILILGLLILIDLWGVNRRYVAPEDFLPERQMSANFTPDAIDQEILRDKDLHYRVHDVSVDAFQNSKRAYFHHMIGGYHAAKLQRYQDIIEQYLSRNDDAMLNMLNARYVIVPDAEGNPQLRVNNQALGNAWFVDSIVIVENADAEIAALENLNPAATVVITKEFEQLVQGFDPIKGGTISLTAYAPDKLKYNSNSTSEQLAVFSEVWYGPNKGWHAYIDGKPVELLRANYILRALKVPAGSHEIEMVFRPERYYMLKSVSLVVSILILLGLVAVIYLSVKKGNLLPPDEIDMDGDATHGTKKVARVSKVKKGKK